MFLTYGLGMNDIVKNQSDSTRIEIFSVTGLKRVTYFQGQILTDGIFREEQEYILNKLRQLNRAALDVGIIKGLTLTCNENNVSIGAGFAMDIAGHIIELKTPCSIEIPGKESFWDVFIQYVEETVEEPLPDWDMFTNPKEYSRIQESVKIWIQKALSTEVAENTDESIYLGRIARELENCYVVMKSSSQ